MSLTTSNIFAALDTKKKKKSKSEKTDKKKKLSKVDKAAELERAIFSQPTITVSSWADADDDDFEAELPPLPSSWADEVENDAAHNGVSAFDDTAHDSGADSDEEAVDLEAELGVEFDKDEDEEDLPQAEDDEQDPSTTETQLHTELSSQASTKLEKMLSKKEKKKKELEELEAVFAELGIDVPRKPDEPELMDPAAGKKKKKDKKEKTGEGVEKDVLQEVTAPIESKSNGVEEGEDPSQDATAVDLEKAKKLAAAKKKASNAKKSSSAAAAAAEAKARAKKLSKHKDTKHYNQAPTR